MSYLYDKRTDFRRIERMIDSIEIDKDDVIMLKILLELAEYEHTNKEIPSKYIWKEAIRAKTNQDNQGYPS